MHPKSFTMGAGAAIVVMAVLAYMFYGIQYSRLQSEFKDELSAELQKAAAASQTGLLTPTAAPVNTAAPATARPLTDDEIIGRALRLGMAFPITSTAEPQPPAETQPPVETQAPDSSFIKVELFAGMNATDIARELAAASVISDETEFISFLREKGVTNRLKAGNFSFPAGADYEEIYRILMGM